MIKYLFTDVDGSLTDGKIYMGTQGEAVKAFSIKDGYAVNYILKPNSIKTIVITARKSSIVINRCKEIGIEDIYQGQIDKCSTIKNIVGVDCLKECAYFGDDMVDLDCMKSIKSAGGVVGCPADAVQAVKSMSDYVCNRKAGEGAFREFSEWLVNHDINYSIINERIDLALNFLKKLDVSSKVTGVNYDVNDYFFYSIQSYQTKPAEQCILESHRKYVDIQLMVDGYEALDVIDISRLSKRLDYNHKNDIVFWEPPSNMSRITLSPGNYVVLYPEYAHRGGIIIGDNGNVVLKVVGKVSIE